MSRKRKSDGGAVSGETHCCAASHSAEGGHVSHNSLHLAEISPKSLLHLTNTDISLILTQTAGLGITDKGADGFNSVYIYMHFTRHSKHSYNIQPHSLQQSHGDIHVHDGFTWRLHTGSQGNA